MLGTFQQFRFLQHSITNSGPEIKNMGAAIAGNDKSFINEAFFRHSYILKIVIKLKFFS